MQLNKLEEHLTNKRQSLYWFEPQYQIDVDELPFFDIVDESLMNNKKQTRAEKLKDVRTVITGKISNSGNVTFCKAIHDSMDESDNQIKAAGCSVKNKGQDVKYFTSMLEFDPESKRDNMKILKKREVQLIQKLKKEKMDQRLLPKNFRD